MPPPILTMQAQEALTRITAELARKERIEADIVSAVNEARQLGATWTEIAKRFDLTRQAVTERFGGYHRIPR